MNNSDFEGPPFGWSVLSIVGGLATAIALILGLEFSADKLETTHTRPTKTAPTVANPTQ